MDTDKSPYVLAAVSGIDSEKKAGKEAINRCVKQGGGKKTCRLSFSYYNQCGAVADSSVAYGAGRAASIERASELAIESCRENGSDTECKIVYAECTDPYYVN